MCKELNLSYTEIKKMSWAMLLRMLADMPRVVYNHENKKENKVLTPQNSNEFKAYIDALNSKKH